MIVDRLGASDSRVIQMIGFTLKYRKLKEWIENYMELKLDSLSWEQFVNRFARWAFLDSLKELKVIEFEQLRQTKEMSVDEYIDKFLQYMGKAHYTETKQAGRHA